MTTQDLLFLPESTAEASDGRAPALALAPGSAYWGHDTFEAFHAAHSGRYETYDGISAQDAHDLMMSRLDNGVHIDAATWIVEHSRNHPGRKYRAEWYFIVPEARATIPGDLLAQLDPLLEPNNGDVPRSP